MSEIKKHIAVIQTDQGHGILNYLSMELKGPGEDESATMGLAIKTKMVELETYQVKSTINSEQIKDIGAMGINAVEMVESALLNEAAMSQEKQIYKKMKLLGYESNRISWTKIQKFANKWIGYIPMVDLSDAKLPTRINLLSHKIAVSSRLGSANFVIIGPGLLQYFAEDNGFSVVDHDSSMNAGAIYQCGTYRENLIVLINPNLPWTDKRVVIGKSTESMNEGIFLVENNNQNEFIRNETVNHVSLTPLVETVLRRRYGLVHTENAAKNYITITCTEKKHNILTHIVDKYFKKKK